MSIIYKLSMEVGFLLLSLYCICLLFSPAIYFSTCSLLGALVSNSLRQTTFTLSHLLLCCVCHLNAWLGYIDFPLQISPPGQQQVDQAQDRGAEANCEPAVEPYLHLLWPAARRPQQRLPGAHCVGQRSPRQQCLPGRGQARSRHRSVAYFNIYQNLGGLEQN